MATSVFVNVKTNHFNIKKPTTLVNVEPKLILKNLPLLASWYDRIFGTQTEDRATLRSDPSAE